MRSSQRTALVTGGGKGIGAAICHRLAQAGHRVVVVGRDSEAVHRVSDAIQGRPLVVDLTDTTALDSALNALMDEGAAPDILVQNAGIAESMPFMETTDEVWNQTFAVNVTAPFRIARRCLPEMVRKGWGRVVNVASNAGLTGYAYTAAYCASKHALVGLTRSLAVEFARRGVTVNAVCPGFSDTAMANRAIANIAAKSGRSPAEARRALEDLNPQKRLVTPQEVAHIVAMLCEDGAQAVNGQAIAVDGGQVM